MLDLRMGAIRRQRGGAQALRQRANAPVWRAFEQGAVNVGHFPRVVRKIGHVCLARVLLQLAGEQADALREHASTPSQIDLSGTGPFVIRLAGQQVIGAAGEQGEEDEYPARSFQQTIDNE